MFPHTVKKQREMNSSVNLLSHLILSRNQAHGVTQPTFREGLHILINLFKIMFLRYTQGYVLLQMILDPIKVRVLTITLSS